MIISTRVLNLKGSILPRDLHGIIRIQHLGVNEISETAHTIGTTRNAYRITRTMDLHNSQRSNFTFQYTSGVRGTSNNVTNRRDSLVFILRLCLQ